MHTNIIIILYFLRNRSAFFPLFPRTFVLQFSPAMHILNAHRHIIITEFYLLTAHTAVYMRHDLWCQMEQ